MTFLQTIQRKFLPPWTGLDLCESTIIPVCLSLTSPPLEPPPKAPSWSKDKQKKCVEQSIILEASWIGTTNGFRLMIRKHPQPTVPILDTTITWAATHPPSCSIIKSSQQAHYSIHPPDPLGFVSTDQDLRDRAGHLEWLSQLELWCRMEKALWVLLPSFAI